MALAVIGIKDYIVIGIVIILVILAILYLVKNKNSCSSCAGCPLSNNCNKKKNRK